MEFFRSNNPITRGFAITALLLLSSNSLAKSPQKTIELATGENYPPFSGRDLPKGGMATEIVSAAFAAAGIATNIVVTSWKRAEAHTVSGKIAATFPYMDTEERRQKYLFSTPIYSMNSYFFVHDTTNLRSATRETLKGKRLCRPIGYGNEPFVQKLIDEKIVVVSSPQSQENCFRQLKQDRVDLVVETELVATRTITAALGKTDGITRLPDLAGTVNLGLMASKNNPTGLAAIEAFNTGMEKIQSNGSYAEIVKRHIENFGVKK